MLPKSENPHFLYGVVSPEANLLFTDHFTYYHPSTISITTPSPFFFVGHIIVSSRMMLSPFQTNHCKLFKIMYVLTIHTLLTDAILNFTLQTHNLVMCPDNVQSAVIKDVRMHTIVGKHNLSSNHCLRSDIDKQVSIEDTGAGERSRLHHEYIQCAPLVKFLYQLFWFFFQTKSIAT